MRSFEAKKCASAQSENWLLKYSPVAHMSTPSTRTSSIRSVRLVENLKNSLPFLFTPRTVAPDATKILSSWPFPAPSVRDAIGSGPVAVLNTKLRVSSPLRMPRACTTPSASPSTILFCRLPLLRGSTSIVPRSACAVCVMSVRSNVSMDIAARRAGARRPDARARRCVRESADFERRNAKKVLVSASNERFEETNADRRSPTGDARRLKGKRRFRNRCSPHACSR